MLGQNLMQKVKEEMYSSQQNHGGEKKLGYVWMFWSVYKTEAEKALIIMKEKHGVSPFR